MVCDRWSNEAMVSMDGCGLLSIISFLKMNGFLWHIINGFIKHIVKEPFVVCAFPASYQDLNDQYGPMSPWKDPFTYSLIGIGFR